MATGTLVAKLAVVNVFLAVAGRTGSGRLGYVPISCPMARLAGNIRMCALQDEACGGVVVEFPQQPVIRVVTGATVLAQAPLVWIILCVAIDAFPGGVGKFR